MNLIRTKRYQILILFILSLMLVVHEYYFFSCTVDDAFISFRYVENFVQGKGLVYNEGEQVEGYTNFLWILMLALLRSMGIDMVIASKILGIILSLLTLITVFQLSHFISEDRKLLNLLAPLLLVSDGSFAYWSVGGLETQLFTFLLTFSVYLYLRELKNGGIILSPLFFALSTMTRPEGLGFTFIALVFLLIFAEKEAKLKNIALWLIIFLLFFLPYFIWRYQYYGFIFPNTFYAKTGRGFRQILSGLHYLHRFFMYYGGIFIFMLASLPLLTRGKKRSHLLLAIISICYLLYIIFISGGDWMLLFRFLVPVLPFIYLLIQEGIKLFYSFLQFLFNGKKLEKVCLFIIIFFITLSNYAVSFSAKNLNHERPFGTSGDQRFFTPIGVWLQRIAPPDSILAAEDCGAIPFYSCLKTIDMRGLTNVHIAHLPAQGKTQERYDADYLLSQKPTFIEIMSDVDIQRDKFHSAWEGDNIIYYHQEFQKNYLPLPPYHRGPGIVIFIRKDKIGEVLAYSYQSWDAKDISELNRIRGLH